MVTRFLEILSYSLQGRPDINIPNEMNVDPLWVPFCTGDWVLSEIFSLKWQAVSGLRTASSGLSGHRCISEALTCRWPQASEHEGEKAVDIHK